MVEAFEVEDVEVDVVEVVAGDGVGVGVCVGVGVESLVEPEETEPGEPEPALDSPTGKTTIFAVMPLGIVTTQKLAPPAPEA